MIDFFKNGEYMGKKKSFISLLVMSSGYSSIKEFKSIRLTQKNEIMKLLIDLGDNQRD